MIIFDLDGTLADCEHRRHFVDPKKNPNYKKRWDATLHECVNNLNISEEYIPIDTTRKEYLNQTYQKFIPDWEAFYEACDKDKPIDPVIQILDGLYFNSKDEKFFLDNIQIWSGRRESVRDNTVKWLIENVLFDGIASKITLKMRHIGDTIPDDELKERWLDEAIAEGKKIEFVFDDRPKVIRMWRRRGIFVFNCCQHDEEF